ncbi:MAG TPA: anti-sigma factor domain-containing protein [Bacillota bacterium]|nr:anti-sigma factor domain-containing protein [Bacillota bacterium]HQD77110.1 anti-sigma factor domain-containing protein [Bacillota bacterium]HUM59329.1 anti-sigma factor domain-containing protein [Bacillota bacterium]
MMKERGMVVKVKSNSCIVLTPEGEYREVPLTEGSRARVGQEIQIPQRKTIPYFRFLMVAASLLAVVVLAGQFFPLAPPAAAYLTIDINPSVELGVTASEKVVSARGLNPDGERILAKVTVKGLKLSDAVDRIVSQAVTDQFLNDIDENIILATLTVEENQEPLVALDTVYEAIEKPVRYSGILAEIIIEPVTPKMREDAAKTGLSTGKFLVLKKSGEKGVPVSVDEVGGSSLGSLEKTKKISIIELLKENGINAAERSVEAEKNANSRKERSGIYYDGRKKATGSVTFTEGKTIKAEAKQEKDKEKDKDKGKKETPGRSDEKNRDNPRNVPGNNGNNKNDKDKNNKDRNDYDRNDQDRKNNKKMNGNKEDKENNNHKNNDGNNKDKSDNWKNNQNDNDGDNNRDRPGENESWSRQRAELTGNKLTGNSRDVLRVPLRWQLELPGINLNPQK